MNKILINIIIGIVVFVGFFLYWGRSSGIFKEGGFIYEWWQTKKANLKKKKNDDDNNA